jgi:UDP-glucuronate decarboxylase
VGIADPEGGSVIVPARHPIIQDDLKAIVGADLPWTVFAGKTVLVSGASGCLPAYMVETLLYLNEHRDRPPTRVIGLVRNRERAEERFAAYRDRPDLHLVTGDVCEPLPVDEPIHFIIHAASQASPKYYGGDPVGTLASNVLGTYHLLDLAADQRIEAFLFFSSGEVYGQVAPDRIPIQETDFGYLDPTDLRSCYGESKRMGETMCVAWAHQFGVPAKIVRPFHTYGPGMRLDDGRVFADFVADIVNDRDIALKSDGRAVRPFCYVADATAGFFAVLLRGAVCQAYNVGSREEISILDLAHLLVAAFPEKGLHVVRQSAAFSTGYLQSPIPRNCPDLAKVKALGWEPHTSIREGFDRTVRSFE